MRNLILIYFYLLIEINSFKLSGLIFVNNLHKLLDINLYNIYNVDILYKIERGINMLVAIICFAIAGIIFICTLQRDIFRANSEKWYKGTIERLNLDNEDISVLNYSNNNLTYRNMLIYTKDDFIYILNKGSRLEKKILKKDILDISLEIYSMEKNVKRLIALTSTFDKTTNIVGVEMKIITTEDTYTIPLVVNNRNADNIQFFNKKELIDNANRYKLLIERDIENIKNENI